MFSFLRSEDGSGSGKKLTHSGLGSPDGDSSSGESQDEKPTTIMDTSTLFPSLHSVTHSQVSLTPGGKPSPTATHPLFSQHGMVNMLTFKHYKQDSFSKISLHFCIIGIKYFTDGVGDKRSYMDLYTVA